MALPINATIAQPSSTRFGLKAIKPEQSFKTLFCGEDSFSRTSNLTSKEAQLKQYQDVLINYPKYAKLGKDDLAQKLSKIDGDEQIGFEAVLKNLRPDELNSYCARGLLGIMEECGDVLFEYAILRALQKEIITPEMIDKIVGQILTPALFPNPENPCHKPDFDSTFEKVLKLTDELSDKQRQQFQAICGLNDPDLAKTLMAITLFKFSMFVYKGDSGHIDNDSNQCDGLKLKEATRQRVYSEIDELSDELNDISKKKQLALKGYRRVLAITPSSKLGVKLHTVPFRLIQPELGKRLTPDDILGYTILKQWGRQKFDYNNPAMSYNDRKAVYKPFEAIFEAYYLKSKLDILP